MESVALRKNVAVMSSDRLKEFWDENSAPLKVQVIEGTIGACTGRVTGE